jgi:hypothetical protein
VLGLLRKMHRAGRRGECGWMGSAQVGRPGTRISLDPGGWLAGSVKKPLKPRHRRLPRTRDPTGPVTPDRPGSC